MSFQRSRVIFRIAMLCAAMACVSWAIAADDEPAVRVDAPDAAALAKTTEQLRSVYKTFYANKTAAGRKALVEKLMAEAATLKDDNATRYAVLTEARAVAMDAGDFDSAIDCVSQLESQFKVDGFKLRVDTLDGMLRNVSAGESAATYTQVAVETAQEAMVKEDMTLATKLLSQAETISRKTNDAVLLASVLPELRAAQDLLSLYRKLDAMQTKLLGEPTNGDALTFVGKFDFLLKKNERGLTHLAKCPDAALQKAATLEQKGNRGATDWADLGDVWLERAKAETSVTFRTAMAKRALYWYGQASNDLTGLRQKVVEQATGEAYKAAGLPAGYLKLTEAERERMVRFGDKWFLVIKSSVTWHDAAKWCAEREGTLASVESAGENRFLWRLAQKEYPGIAHGSWWLGGNDADKEGIWRWHDGTKMTYRNWPRGQPDNSGGAEHWLQYTEGGKWNDVVATHGFHFFAQWRVK